jgi:class 3 adenylate cyclase
MRCHPAPTFVFADLVGYTALTEERGNEDAARESRASSAARCAH